MTSPNQAEPPKPARDIDVSRKAADRLIEAVQTQYRYHLNDGGKLNKEQIATVLHALADHTAIMGMLQYRKERISPWPEATSIGRWFHDVGYALEDKKEETL